MIFEVSRSSSMMLCFFLGNGCGDTVEVLDTHIFFQRIVILINASAPFSYLVLLGSDEYGRAWVNLDCYSREL